MIKAMWSVAMAAGLAIFSGAAHAAPCPEGVDPTYCALAEATGGSVIYCDVKKLGKQACDKFMMDFLEKQIEKDRSEARKRQEIAKVESAAAHEKWLASLPPQERQSMERQERLDAQRAQNRQMGMVGWIGASAASVLAFFAWLALLGKAQARWAALGLGVALLVAGGSLLVMVGALPMRGDYDFPLLLVLMPVASCAGISWRIAESKAGSSPAASERAWAGVKSLLGLALGIALWFLLAVAMIQ